MSRACSPLLAISRTPPALLAGSGPVEGSMKDTPKIMGTRISKKRGMAALLDRFVELPVVPLPVRGRIEIDFNIGRNTVVLDLPLAVKTVNCGARRGHPAAIDKFGISSDAHQSAPCLLADQLANAGFAEIPGQSIATGTGHLVDEHDLGAVDRFRRTKPVVAFAGDDLAHQRTAQVVDDVVGEFAALLDAFG